MKKLFLTILLTLAISMGFSQTEVPFLEEDVQTTLDSVLMELEQSRELSAHYRQMAVYAEERTLVAEMREQATLSHLDGLYTSLTIANDLLEKSNGVNNVLIESNASALVLLNKHESLQATYEVQLYDALTIRQADELKIEKLEAELKSTQRNTYLISLGVIVCFILYFLSKILTRNKVSKSEPVEETETEEKPKLEVVKGTKKEEEKVEETKPSIPKIGRFKSWNIQRLKMKTLKKNIKLEKARKKALTQKPTDIEETTDTVKENNVKILKGGVLTKFIGFIMKTKPIEETQTGENKVDKSEKTETDKPKTGTKKTNVPKKQAPKKQAKKKTK